MDANKRAALLMNMSNGVNVKLVEELEVSCPKRLRIKSVKGPDEIAEYIKALSNIAIIDKGGVNV